MCVMRVMFDVHRHAGVIIALTTGSLTGMTGSRFF